MEPSWTSPIPQAMQQHRGSQEHKPEPANPAAPTKAAEPDDSSRSKVAAGNENLSKV